MSGKRRAALVLILAMLLSLTGCSAVSVEQDKTELFVSSGMEMVLPAYFEEHDVDGYTVCYASPTATVFALREDFSLAEGVEAMTVQEYAELVYLANAAKSPSAITEEEGFPLMEYTYRVETSGKDYVYLSAMYKANDAFWTVQFVCAEADYEEYRPQFITWAKSVKFISAE